MITLTITIDVPVADGKATGVSILRKTAHTNANQAEWAVEAAMREAYQAVADGIEQALSGKEIS